MLRLEQVISQNTEFIYNILGLNVATKRQALRFGDAELNPGTRLHFVEVPNPNYRNVHISSVGLRTPSNAGLEEYQQILEK